MRFPLPHPSPAVAGLLLMASPVLADLTRVEEVRALTQEQARGQIPVRLRGVVTFLDPFIQHAFLQDATGSVFFTPDKASVDRIKPGDAVDITGLTVAGQYSPSVAGGMAADGSRLPVHLELLGERREPATESVDLREIRQARWHDQYVRTSGTLRDFRGGEAANSKLILTLSDRAGQLTECWITRAAAPPREWLNSAVELHAVVAGGRNTRGQFGSVRLLANDLGEVTRLPDTTPDGPVTIADLFLYQPQFSAYAEAPPRLPVEGSVTMVQPDGTFYLTDGKHGLQVQSPVKTGLRLGDLVKVSGYPARGAQGTFLADAVVSLTGHGPSPPALRRTLGEASEALAEASPATLTGTIAALAETAGEQLISLTDPNGHSFEARNPAPVPLSIGAQVSLTGICRTAYDETGRLTLLLRSAQDITVLRAAPWLSAARLRWLLAGCGAALAMAAGWLILLKRQVRRQTRELLDGVVERTLLEERHRLGRDLHDSLEQQLAGLHLHLAALQDWSTEEPPAPPNIRGSIAAAGRMLDHCRQEARRAVQDLRTSPQDAGGLAENLRRIADGPHPPGSPAITFEITGTPAPVAPLTDFHLSRCVSEALGNVLKHAHATEVAIKLHHAADHLVLSISDDGGGFDPAAVRAAGGPHFGLLHLQERASRLNGTFDLHSTPRQGTTLTFTIPSLS
jgi:signal transduction histidine kinase